MKNVRLLTIVLAVIAATCAVGTPSTPTQAESNAAFGPPLAKPASLDSWLLEQHYGNTVEALSFGKYWYADGQGLHFGLDLEAPCGTHVMAIADGEVRWINNGTYGAEPNNLVINHPELNVQSVYGHLLEKSKLMVGQPVVKGQVVGLVGDPDLTCQSRPHLHLEIRSLDGRTALNPAQYLPLDWDALALLGRPIGIEFARDLLYPRRWQDINDQPDIGFQNRTLNAYELSHPPLIRFQAMPATLPAFTTPEPTSVPSLRQVTEDGCCTRAWWSSDSRHLHYLDGPSGDLASVYQIGFSKNDSPQMMESAPPSIYSPNGAYRFEQRNGRATITRLRDGREFALPTRGYPITFSPRSRLVLWHVRPSEYFPGFLPSTEVWISGVEGIPEPRLVKIQRGGAVYWLDETRLLLVETENKTQRNTLSILSVASGRQTPLGTFDNLRRLSISPGGKYVAFLLPFQTSETVGDLDSGVYLLPTHANAMPQKLTWVGSWRWQDLNHLIYVPFTPNGEMTFRRYNVETGADTLLSTIGVRISNDDWSVSPDGTHIAFRSAQNGALWLMQLMP